MNMYLTHVNAVLQDEVLLDCSIEIEDGKIASVNPVNKRKHSTPDFPLPGCLLLPGLIDLHCDVLEKKIEPRPNVQFPVGFALNQADKLFAAAGITTVYHSLSFANHEWGVRNTSFAEQIVMEISGYNRCALVDNKAHCRYEITDPDGLPSILRLIGHQTVQMISFMDHSPGQGQFKNLAAYIDYHAGEYGVTRKHVETLLERKRKNGPDALQRIQNIARLAYPLRIPLASHDDDTPVKVDLMRDFGVTISEFPVTLAAAQQACRNGMHTVFGAPNIVRGRSQSGSVRALDVLRAGALDCLCSDYYPASLIHSLFIIVEESELTLPQAVRLVTANPAAASGLTDRGKIAEEMRADFTAVGFVKDLPVVLATIANGRCVYRAGYQAEPQKLAIAC